MKRWGRPGATQVVVAVAMPVLIGFAALAVDIGRLVVEKQRLNHLCDAAARAGGSELPTGATVQGGLALKAAEQVAAHYAQANSAGINGLQFTAQAKPGPSGYQLEVTAQENVPMGFARIWGWKHRPVQARAVAEREPVPGWIPLAVVEGQFNWRVAPLSQCARGQWWVTGVNGQPIDFQVAFRDGAGLALSPGDTIQLSRVPDAFAQRVVFAAGERIRGQASGLDVVQVPLIDNVVNPKTGKPVQDGDVVGAATFTQFASIRLIGVDDASKDLRHALGLERISTGSGPLSGGQTNSTGAVRLVK
jgi:hypothetical protein